jgi:hypothetical protein
MDWKRLVAERRVERAPAATKQELDELRVMVERNHRAGTAKYGARHVFVRTEKKVPGSVLPEAFRAEPRGAVLSGASRAADGVDRPRARA